MTKRLALLLFAAACGEPSQTSPDADISALDRIGGGPVCGLFYPAVHHSGTILADETWGPDRIHYVDSDLLVKAHVTVGVCADIIVAAGKTIELDAGGTLQPPAGNTSPSGVTFQPGSGAWGRLWINGGAFLLNGATVSGAGAIGPGAVTLDSGTLDVQGLTIASATTLGLAVTGGTITPASQGLVITGAGSAAAQVPAERIGELPPGSYTGNAEDAIRVETGTVVSTSQTWRNLGVPYHFTGAGYVKVTGSPVAVVTIEPGTTLAFDKGAGMQIDPAIDKTTAASGALHAVGLGTQQIIFTSASPTPMPGDWQGLFFGGIIDPSTAISQAHIAFAGGPGGGSLASCPTPTDPYFADDAAIRFLNSPMPTQSFVTYTTIEHSKKNGIDRSFKLTSTQTPAMVPDFTALNAFSDIAECNQTHTRAYGNGCPSTPQCN